MKLFWLAIYGFLLAIWAFAAFLAIRDAHAGLDEQASVSLMQLPYSESYAHAWDPSPAKQSMG
jgi:hypothetical protein